MSRDEQLEELEIEIARLRNEVARLHKVIAKAYAALSLGTIHRPLTARPMGRPSGTTRMQEEVFKRDLWEAYASLPENKRTRQEVAAKLGINRRTLLRYLERWVILWPPIQTETLEEVLARLKAEQERANGT